MQARARIHDSPVQPRPSRQPRFMVAALLMGWCAVMLTGCGKVEGPERFPVEGTVTYEGQPVPSGLLVLEPDPTRGSGGPVSVLEIRNGRFDSRKQGAKGPLRGPLLAKITGYPEADPNVEVSKPLFPEFQTTLELIPAGDVSLLEFKIERPKRTR